MPPSTLRLWPVTNAASSDARNATGPTTTHRSRLRDCTLIRFAAFTASEFRCRTVQPFSLTIYKQRTTSHSSEPASRWKHSQGGCIDALLAARRAGSPENFSVWLMPEETACLPSDGWRSRRLQGLLHSDQRKRSADDVRLEVPGHKDFDFGYRPALSKTAEYLG